MVASCSGLSTHSIAAAVSLCTAAAAAQAHDNQAPDSTPLTMTPLDTFNTGGAEIAAFDPQSKRIFATNAAASTVTILDARSPRALSLIGTIDTSPFGSPNSVAVKDGIVAIAIEAPVKTDAGRVGSSQEAVYSACKGGIIAFTKTVAREMARKGITLNAVCPGPTDTPLLAAVAGDDERGQRVRAALVGAIPMKRVGQPEDIPGAVCFLASDDASFITGQTISVSGGLTMHG